MAELREKDLQQVDGGLSYDNFIIDPGVCIYPDIEIDTDKIMYMDVDTIDPNFYPNWEILPTP